MKRIPIAFLPIILLFNIFCLATEFRSRVAKNAFVNYYEKQEHRDSAATCRLGGNAKLFRVSCQGIIERMPLNLLMSESRKQSGRDYWLALLFLGDELEQCLEFEVIDGEYELIGTMKQEFAFTVQEMLLANKGTVPVIFGCSPYDYFYHIPEKGDSNLTPLYTLSVTADAYKAAVAKESNLMKALRNSGIPDTEFTPNNPEYSEFLQDYQKNEFPGFRKKLAQESDFRKVESYRTTARWFKEYYRSPF